MNVCSIIFEAGYVQCNNRVFMDNLGSILINAIIGTTFNTFALGQSRRARACVCVCVCVFVYLCVCVPVCSSLPLFSVLALV